MVTIAEREAEAKAISIPQRTIEFQREHQGREYAGRIEHIITERKAAKKRALSDVALAKIQEAKQIADQKTAEAKALAQWRERNKQAVLHPETGEQLGYAVTPAEQQSILEQRWWKETRGTTPYKEWAMGPVPMKQLSVYEPMGAILIEGKPYMPTSGGAPESIITRVGEAKSKERYNQVLGIPIPTKLDPGKMPRREIYIGGQWLPYKTSAEKQFVRERQKTIKLLQSEPDIGERALITAERRRVEEGALHPFWTPIKREGEKIQAKYLYPITQILPDIYLTKQQSQEFLKDQPIGVAPFAPYISMEMLDFTRGAYMGIKYEPIKAVAIGATFFAAPLVLKGAGAALSFAGKGVTALVGTTAISAAKFGIGAKVIAPIAKVGVKYGLPALYAGGIGLKIASFPQDKRAEQAGRIFSTEIAPMVIGGYAGAVFWPRVGTWIKSGGQKLVKEDIFPKEYLKQMKAGKEGIPTEPVKTHLELFTSKKYAPPGTKEPIMYHLAGGKFVGISKGSGGEKLLTVLTTKQMKALGLDVKAREAAGLFGAPYPSTHFARLGKSQLYGGDTLFSSYGSPRGIIAQPTKFLEAGIVKGQIRVPAGYAGIPGRIIGKTEPQAIIPEESILRFTGEKSYFWHKGYKIIFEKAIALKGPSFGDAIGETTKTLVSSSEFGGGYAYATTPASYAISSSISQLSYVPSSKPSTSYIPSSKIAPSYKVSKSLSMPKSISKMSIPSKSIISSKAISSIISPSLVNIPSPYILESSYTKPSGPPIFPEIRLPTYGKKKRVIGVRKSSVSTRYQPSLTGTVLGITIPKVPKMGRIGYIPARIRGIPKTWLKKARKAKKKKKKSIFDITF